MNGKRIVAGGLLAGLVMNALEFAFEPLTRPQMEIFFSRLGLAMPGEESMMAVVLGMFVLGIVTIWLYAAIVPQYGPGKGTAVVAGVTSWTLSCMLPNVVFLVFGVFTPAFFWLASACSLVESVLGTLAGAAVVSRGPATATGLSGARA